MHFEDYLRRLKENNFSIHASFFGQAIELLLKYELVELDLIVRTDRCPHILGHQYIPRVKKEKTRAVVLGIQYSASTKWCDN